MSLAHEQESILHHKPQLLSTALWKIKIPSVECFKIQKLELLNLLGHGPLTKRKENERLVLNVWKQARFSLYPVLEV